MVQVSVKRWQAWLPGFHGRSDVAQWALGQASAGDAALDLSAVPAMQRRRLGAVGRPVATVAWDLISGDDQQALIFASRHGDQTKTLQLLAEIGANQPLSPAAFSLSVHNAIGGLLSIALKARGPHTALAGERLMSSAIIEAYGQLMAGSQSVICVIYDFPLPDDYDCADQQSIAYAIALELQLGRDLVLESSEQGKPLTEPEPLTWLRWWAGKQSEPLSLEDDRGCWRWGHR